MTDDIALDRLEIGGRLRSERTRLGLSQGDMAVTCGVSKTSQVNYESGERSPDAVYLRLLGLAGGDISYVVSNVRTTSAEPAAGEFVSIPMLGVTASAGNGQVNEPSAEYRVEGGLAFSKAWLNRRNLPAASLKVIEVRGASMDGVLADGDLVLINLADTKPKSGFVYVIRQGDELLVKYCQLLPGGILRVSSANSQFATYDVELDKTPDVAIIGRVVASMHEW